MNSALFCNFGGCGFVIRQRAFHRASRWRTKNTVVGQNVDPAKGVVELGGKQSVKAVLFSKQLDGLCVEFGLIKHFKFSVGCVATPTGAHPAALVKLAGGVIAPAMA